MPASAESPCQERNVFQGDLLQVSSRGQFYNVLEELPQLLPTPLVKGAAPSCSKACLRGSFAVKNFCRVHSDPYMKSILTGTACNDLQS